MYIVCLTLPNLKSMWGHNGCFRSLYNVYVQRNLCETLKTEHELNDRMLRSLFYVVGNSFSVIRALRDSTLGSWKDLYFEH